MQFILTFLTNLTNQVYHFCIIYQTVRILSVFLYTYLSIFLCSFLNILLVSMSFSDIDCFFCVFAVTECILDLKAKLHSFCVRITLKCIYYVKYKVNKINTSKSHTNICVYIFSQHRLWIWILSALANAHVL